MKQKNQKLKGGKLKKQKMENKADVKSASFPFSKKQKMENKTIYIFLALGIIALLGVSAFVSANSGLGFGQGIGLGSELTNEQKADIQEYRESIREAIESGDFDTWKSLMDARIDAMKEKLTEDNFNKIVERHKQRSETREELKSLMEEARESGDFSEVREYIKENNLQRPVMKHMKQRFFSGTQSN